MALPVVLFAVVAAGLTLPPATGQTADGAIGRPEELPPLDRGRSAPGFGEIDALLRQQKWAAAMAHLRAREARLSYGPGQRGAWLARVAVAEAGSGPDDQALWHWAAANVLSTGVFSDEELRSFGAAGTLLAGHPLRQAGKAPPGASVEPPGPEVQREVQTQGELPKLAQGAWEPRPWLRLEVVVDEQGRLRDPLVLSASSEEAAYRALEAIRNWRFEPARKQGRPVAMLHSLAINPPGHLALDQLIALSAQTKAIEYMLRRQQWRQAGEQAERRWRGLLDSTGPDGQDAERAALGMTMALRALARLDEDVEDMAWARCRWEAAQSLMPSLYDLDLSPYGAAGKALAAWRSDAFNAPFRPYSMGPETVRRTSEVKRPQKIKATPPYFPGAAKKERLGGRVIVASFLDTEGRVRNPVVLSPIDTGDPAVFAASALDAVCDWRFKPATLEGKPVKVYYTLTVSFQVR